MNDAELLQRYVLEGSQQAFTELVERHLNLVFAAALRQVGGDRQLAEDVAQSVFSDLARKAATLSKREVLSGWLYTSARFAAAKVVRGEQRRFAREQHALLMASSTDENSQWEQIQPILDDAMHELKAQERNMIVMRFLEGRALDEVGASLGVTNDAARMRIDRALEKLRKMLGRRGVTTSVAALAILIGQQAAVAAPAGLSAVIAGSALASAAQGLSAVGILELIFMSKIKLAVAVALLAGVSVPLLMQERAKSALKTSREELARQLVATEGELAPLRDQNTRLSNALARVEAANRGNEELMKLRAEVTRLRAEKQASSTLTGQPPGDPLDDTLRTLGARAAKLKERVREMPDKQIPELSMLKEKDWLDAVAKVPGLESEEDVREAMNVLRAIAKSSFGNDMKKALQKFADANDGMLPMDLSQLQSYLEHPVDPSAFQRYKLAASGKLDDLPKDKSIIEETAPPVDEEHDSRFVFFRNGTSSSSGSQIGDEIENAVKAFATANQGFLPRDPGQIAGLLKRPIDPARVQKFLNKIPPGVTTLDQMLAQRH